jgi:hypothetical protein
MVYIHDQVKAMRYNCELHFSEMYLAMMGVASRDLTFYCTKY